MDQEIKKSILRIKEDNKEKKFLGMGFIVFSDMKGTYILTAAHVIENAKGTIRLNIEGSTETEILCQGDKSLNDMAVIFVKDLKDYKPIRLYKPEALIPVGQEYSLVGHARQDNFYRESEVRGTIIEHVVQSVEEKNPRITVYEIDTTYQNEIIQGYSGTAVFLSNTDIVIGVLSAQRKSSKLAYVIPIQQLKNIWNNKKNWDDESKWREIPSVWFHDDIWSRIKNRNSYVPTKKLFFLSTYPRQRPLLKALIILSVISVLFYLVNIVRIKESEYLNKLGENAYHTKNYRLAIDYYDNALLYDSDSYKVYSNLGLAYEKYGDLKSAIEKNNLAIRLAKDYDDNQWQANSYYNNARIYEKIGEWEKALNSYQNALAKNEHLIYRKAIKRMKQKLQN